MLPVDTDIHIAEKIAVDGARAAFDRFGIRSLVLPTMPFGLALHHMRFPGTITLQPETYVAAVADVLRCVVKHGFRRIAVITGHGGNEPALHLAMDKVVQEYTDRRALRIALFRMHRDEAFSQSSREIWKDEGSEGQPGIHAGRWETSETLADRPHLVKREGMLRPELKRSTVPEWVWMTDELTPTGAFGDPSMARADLGERIWAAWADAVALFLKRLADENLPEGPSGPAETEDG